LPATPHTFGDKDSFILRYGTANLQQQLIVRVLTHGPIKKLHLAAASLPFFDEQNLVNKPASQSIRAGHQHPLEAGTLHRISELVQTRSV